MSARGPRRATADRGLTRVAPARHRRRRDCTRILGMRPPHERAAFDRPVARVALPESRTGELHCRYGPAGTHHCRSDGQVRETLHSRHQDYRRRCSRVLGWRYVGGPATEGFPADHPRRHPCLPGVCGRARTTNQGNTCGLKLVRLLFDEQLSERLGSLLRDVLPETLHVREIGAGGASDTTVWRLAQERRCTLVTKDEDFHRLSVLRGVRWSRSLGQSEG